MSVSKHETVVNGHRFVNWSHIDTALGRRLAAKLDRGHERVDRIDPSTNEVTVWLEGPETGQDMYGFQTPDGWTVEKTSWFGDGTVALDLKPEGSA